ncbi:hypothetical protein [Ignatzschineria sp. F8392]|nr:hypothetical protein [Ignatzschineria sp. F8392]
MILKRVCGAVGAYYFVLFTTACPPFGIFDAEEVFYLTDDIVAGD